MLAIGISLLAKLHKGLDSDLDLGDSAAGYTEITKGILGAA